MKKEKEAAEKELKEKQAKELKALQTGGTKEEEGEKEEVNLQLQNCGIATLAKC